MPRTCAPICDISRQCFASWLSQETPARGEYTPRASFWRALVALHTAQRSATTCGRRRSTRMGSKRKGHRRRKGRKRPVECWCPLCLSGWYLWSKRRELPVHVIGHLLALTLAGVLNRVLGRYFTLGRPATMRRYSSSVKAREVSMRTLPFEPIPSDSFTAVSSSGASAITTASYFPVTR